MTFEQILILIPTIIALASAIVAATPTPRDDEFLAKVLKAVRVLALNVGNAKQE